MNRQQQPASMTPGLWPGGLLEQQGREECGPLLDAHHADDRSWLQCTRGAAGCCIRTLQGSGFASAFWLTTHECCGACCLYQLAIACSLGGLYNMLCGLLLSL